MRADMELHHLVWLSVHPERTKEWLKERLKDGFDVHHINGDHADNEPQNLVLIDCGDHMMLHSGHRLRRVSGKGGGRPKKVRSAVGFFYCAAPPRFASNDS